MKHLILACLFLIITLLVHNCAKCQDVPPIREGLHKLPFADWQSISRSTLDNRLKTANKFNENKAKNVIFFVGDGLTFASHTVARVHKSQKEHITIDKVHLAWDHFVHTGIVKTYNVDRLVPDSAGTATAFNCGIKTRCKVIGVDERVVHNSNCSLYTEENNCKSALQYAKDSGKLTGIITNTRMSHATPAAAYAHSPNRDWESDGEMPENLRPHCDDIPRQLVFRPENHDIRVLLGGGRRGFYLNSEPDVEYPELRGYRLDSNLVEEWLRIKKESGLSEEEYKYIFKQSEFDDVDPEKTKYLLGLFDWNFMQYEADRQKDGAGEPSLAEMVEKSIKILQKSENGYYLYVEGGLIDQAHHQNFAQKASVDTLAFSDAVQKALEMSDSEDTLILVTSDHSHSFSFQGYPHPDSPIYGVVYEHDASLAQGEDGLPYMPLGYGTGPGIRGHLGVNNTRRDLTNEPAELYDDPDYRQPTMIDRYEATHAGEEVGMFALGPWSHLFTGTVEQHYIADALMYAACIKPDLQGDHCKDTDAAAACSSRSTNLLLGCLATYYFIRIFINIFK